MKFKSESEFSRWFCKCCEAMGAKTVAFVGSTMQQNGISDRYISHPIFRGWVEFKRNFNKCTPLQCDFLEGMVRVGDAGLVVRLIDNLYVGFEDVYENSIDKVGMKYLIALNNDKARGKYLLESLHDTWEIAE